MSENPEIKQISTLGSQGTQIGIQNINVGLTPNDAMQMAMRMFHEYYPQLKNEVLEEIQQTVLEKLKNEPPENITSPSPRIAFPAIQNACITPEKEIRELFEELLANSMKKSVPNGVFPSFVDIIKQLCPDEAKILRYMKYYNSIPTVTLKYENEKGSGFSEVKNFSNVGELMACENPYDISLYFDNLCRLGLLYNHGGMASLTDKKLYEPLKNHPYIQIHLDNEKYIERGFNKTRIQEGFIELTDFGKSFCKICLDNRPIITIKTRVVSKELEVIP